VRRKLHGAKQNEALIIAAHGKVLSSKIGSLALMIDTHCHLYSVENPLEAARAPGLNALVVIGHTPDHARDALKLSRELEHVYVTVGLHPCDANLYDLYNTTELEELMMEDKVVGIGESGIDYYWDSAPKNLQLESLNWQLECARRFDMPIVIHTRDKDNSRQAFADCALELRNAGWNKGILHCFAGDTELLETGLDLGFHVSFAGNLTYKNAQSIRDGAAIVPLERLLVETDAPYLAPMPFRGKRNTPANLRYTLEKLAEIRGLEFAEMERITEANSRLVFRIPVTVE
jgi:TatD DNase family protein